MARVSNAEAGRGYTHKVRIDLDDYRQISGNADQTIEILSSEYGTGLYIKSVFIVIPATITAGGNVITVSVDGSGSSFISSAAVTGASVGISAVNTGLYFNDGTTDNVVNGVSEGSATAIIATLSLDAGNWSSNNGGHFFVCLDAFDASDVINS